MKKALITIIAIGTMFPATAQAVSLYVTANAGLALLSDSTVSDPAGTFGLFDIEYDEGFLAAAGIGIDFGPIRAEGAVQYQKNELDSITIPGYVPVGDLSTTAFMFNGYWDINTGFSVEPFITAGAGLAQVEVDSIADDDDSVFAWQAGAGVGFGLNDKAYLDITYRYFATSDPSIFGVDWEVSGHNFSAGLRYNF
jgi:opacity protein-like surface antigen